MTVEEQLAKLLIDRGMFESQAAEVMKVAKPELLKLADGYNIKFDVESTHYDEIMYSVWWVALKKIALDWIVENKPMAWFRPTFEA